MASNLFHTPEGRPDPAHWTRMNVGFASPLWLPFLMAAGAGAAWWTYANWTRLAASPWTGDLQRLGGADGARDATAAAPSSTAAASLEQNLAVQGDGAGDLGSEDAGVDDGSDAIDAAYAANLGPVPTPKKRAAAKKTAGGAKKTAAKKVPAKKTAAKKALPKSGGRR